MAYLSFLPSHSANFPRHMYLPAITLESVGIIDNLSVAFVNATIHLLPLMEHFMALNFAYLSN